jgi:DNA-binding phage protein
MLKEDIDKMERSALYRAQESECNITLDNVSVVSDKYNIKMNA